MSGVAIRKELRNVIYKKLGIDVSNKIRIFNINENQLRVTLCGEDIIKISCDTIEKFHGVDYFGDVINDMVKTNLLNEETRYYNFECTDMYAKLTAGEYEALNSNKGIDSHYHENNSIDPITFGKNNFSKEEMLGFYRMSAIKYITRYGKKKGYNSDDLNKAIDYINYIKGLEME